MRHSTNWWDLLFEAGILSLVYMILGKLQLNKGKFPPNLRLYQGIPKDCKYPSGEWRQVMNPLMLVSGSCPASQTSKTNTSAAHALVLRSLQLHELDSSSPKTNGMRGELWCVLGVLLCTMSRVCHVFVTFVVFQYVSEFGTDHVYNCDSFNEMTPRSS